ncbi:hypothetical protein BDV25DRAFT_172138 [Aspergillus avenaceus]|uniref:Uncharacterized protein n=1 Tax=Aspergillus avenaceus TaxID=36643 RepID=A0A5N6TW47_ASPAV|nr:hypothetical protein BDV25DRAFT_172138 [Aspergillus avenaceus]
METRQTRRKRSLGSISNSEPHSPASGRRTRQSAKSTSAPRRETSRQAAKRVRFSDPGPRLEKGDSGCSTGLTPAMTRTSFKGPADNTDHINGTPSRRLRRRSTPLPRDRHSLDPSFPVNGSQSERVVQFTPLRQILDSRTQRRLRRVGLSNEINMLEREKRESTQHHKTLQALLKERDSLKQELESERRNRGITQSPSVGSIMDQPEDDTEGDTIIMNDRFEGDTILMSDSPDMRGLDNARFSPPEFSLLPSRSTADVAIEAVVPDPDQEAERIALSSDLETARKEKRALFTACRSRLASFGGTAIERCLRHPSPPTDFLDHILPTLTEAITHTSDAINTLGTVKEELTSLGFSGNSVDEIITEMRTQFRSARLQLERAVPGETPSSSLNDGNATLGALVRRVELLVKNLGEERTRHEGSLDRERVLRGQFDTLLVRYESASKKISDLEESISSTAGDMLHTRMRMQELEHEGKEQALGIERLNAALKKYREEVKRLEKLVTELEENNAASNDSHREEVAQRDKRITEEQEARRAAELALTERDVRIQELEGVVESNRIRMCDITTQIEALVKELRRVRDEAEQQTAEQRQHHQQEIGNMNVRVSELSTSLDSARSEAEKLRRSNAALEEQLHLEMEARDNMLEKWAADQARSFAYMKETVKAERRRARVRTANWELKSDELQSEGTNIGSEPITPVSMTRYVDVEVGRGKERRRLDSGIGILSDDFHESEVAIPSDPADL